MNKQQAITAIHQRITDTIVKQMELGGNWLKPFTSSSATPTNALTGKQYNGINRLHLTMLGGGYYATWKQWKQLGATWKEGTDSKTDSAPVLYADKKTFEKENSKGEKEMRAYFFVRWSNVYSADQVNLPDALHAKLYGEETTVDLTSNIKAADQYISNIGCAIRHKAGGQAYNSDATNQITMPLRTEFVDNEHGTATEHYYSTLFHEITHWTGSDLRLKRTKGKRFGDAEYGFEELVAELGAAFQCQARGITKVDDTRESHATYLASWIKACKDQPDAIIKAAKLAQASVTYCDSLQPDAAEKAAQEDTMQLAKANKAQRTAIYRKWRQNNQGMTARFRLSDGSMVRNVARYRIRRIHSLIK